MSKLIFGCGYLGSRVAGSWLAAGHAVAAITRSSETAAKLASCGVVPIVADVTRPETLVRLPVADTVLYAVGYDPKSGKSRRQVYVDGLRAALDALPVGTGQIVFISSTGVYGDFGGDWIDEESPCRPTREAGRAFLEAEDVLRRHPRGQQTTILRMAGIYGPGRTMRTADLLAGRPLAVEADNYLNLIHVEDAATVVLAAESAAGSRAEVPRQSTGPMPRLYLVSDGQPVDRRACYRFLAELLGASPPQFIEPSADYLASHHSGGNKRVRNARMLKELGVRLRYSGYREGFGAIVDGPE